MEDNVDRLTRVAASRGVANVATDHSESRAGIWVWRGTERADATSVLELLGIACEKGTTITLAIDDPGDTPVLEDLVRLVENGFGE